MSVTYGGQAVIEGVFIRGKRTLALACRLPDGTIHREREPLSSLLQRSRIARAPLARGIVVLYESLSHGLRMLTRSADLQLEDQGHSLGSAGGAGIMSVTGLLVLVVFVGVPYLVTQALHGIIASTLALNVAEGLLRLALLLGYLVAISLMEDIRRVYAYHGAEHMAIHAHEHGDPLDVDHVRPYPTAHPRCGTAFLLLVVVIAIVLFAFVPRTQIVVDLVARLALVLPVAALSYEVLRFGAAHDGSPLMRLVVAPGLLLQRLTTRRPDDRMIEVAIASLEEALAGDAA